MCYLYARVGTPCQDTKKVRGSSRLPGVRCMSIVSSSPPRASIGRDPAGPTGSCMQPNIHSSTSQTSYDRMVFLIAVILVELYL